MQADVQSVITNNLISLDTTNACCGGFDSIAIYQNTANAFNSTPIVNCTSAMLPLCGDNAGITVDPSGKYLFVTDATTNEVPIVYVSTAKGKLEESGASIPGNPTFIAFTPDHLLVFTVEKEGFWFTCLILARAS